MPPARAACAGRASTCARWGSGSARRSSRDAPRDPEHGQHGRRPGQPAGALRPDQQPAPTASCSTRCASRSTRCWWARGPCAPSATAGSSATGERRGAARRARARRGAAGVHRLRAPGSATRTSPLLAEPDGAGSRCSPPPPRACRRSPPQVEYVRAPGVGRRRPRPRSRESCASASASAPFCARAAPTSRGGCSPTAARRAAALARARGRRRRAGRRARHCGSWRAPSSSPRRTSSCGACCAPARTCSCATALRPRRARLARDHREQLAGELTALRGHPRRRRICERRPRRRRAPPALSAAHLAAASASDLSSTSCRSPGVMPARSRARRFTASGSLQRQHRRRSARRCWAP